MTAKSLHFISLLFFSLSLFAQSEQEIISSQLKEAQEIHAQWKEMKKNGIKKRDLYEGQAERADYIISGIPKYIKEINSSGIIYRHYTGNHTAIIVETNQLKTGITPYIIMNPGYSREVYEDLVGIFLTTPMTPPERVGLPRNNNADYIDFTLYAGTPVVEIEKEILLIPGRPDLPAWLKSLYLDYKNTGRYDVHYLEIFKKADARGGVNPTFMKINIQSYRMNGKVTFR
jgi:hypothetical protein